MHFSTLATAALVAQASAKVVTVAVAQNGLAFTPNNIKADVGDTLEFQFYPAQHSVIQGDGSKACQPLAGGFYSGVVKSTGGMNPQVFRVTVTSTDEMFIYCGVSTHCADGMNAVINPKSDADVTNFANAAANADSSVAPSGGPTGGVFAAAGSPVSGGSSMMSSMMMSSSMAPASSSMMMSSAPASMSSMMTSMAMSSSMAASSSSAAAATSSAASVPTNAAGSVQGGVGGAMAAVAAVAAFVL